MIGVYRGARHFIEKQGILVGELARMVGGWSGGEGTWRTGVWRSSGSFFCHFIYVGSMTSVEQGVLLKPE